MISIYVPPATLATSNGPEEKRYTLAYYLNRAAQTRASVADGMIAPGGEPPLRPGHDQVPDATPNTKRIRRRSLTLAERLALANPENTRLPDAPKAPNVPP